MRIDLSKNSNYFYRVVFTLLIALGHSGLVSINHASYYLGVDYFFIISGFMLVWGCERKSELHVKEDTSTYILRRVGKLWPSHFGAYLCWIIYLICIEKSVRIGLIYFIRHLPECLPFTYFLGTQELMGGYAFNFATWYLSVLLILSVLIHYFYMQYRETMANVIAPLAIFLIYQYIVSHYTNFNIGGSLYVYLIRGAADMCGGVVIFQLLKRISQARYRKSFFLLARIMEVVFFGIVILGMVSYGNSIYDIFLIMALHFGILFSFIHSEQEKGSSTILVKISELMYPVYLNHLLVKSMLNNFLMNFEYSSKIQVILYFIMLMLFALIFKMIMDSLVHIVRKCKNAFVKE